MTSFKLEVRKELLDRYNQVLDIAAEYGYNPSSYGVRGDVIKSIHAMFTDKQNDNVRAFALRVKIKGSVPVTYVAELKTRSDMIDAPTVVLDNNKLLEFNSVDEFRDFVDELRGKNKLIIKAEQETEEIILEV
ncbi:hypothetical protein [Ligilactobacillus salivarius]|jgi:hypothetical protein|uniref:hypothetical protein n=1 Tax=Ligilactobacillus salivarius TaxID=1624 RepID=UPI0013703A38|nr:hypothetical protein [Ligilactobacillus salivarius]MYV10626.1 hypothetical protein [Ligilactobacillus salivarius]